MSPIIDLHERPPLQKIIPLSFQHLFAMFGGTILAPILFGIDPSIALLCNGCGTLIYLIVCKGQIPAYLGSSFAFIAPVTAILNAPQYQGIATAQSGFVGFGLFFMVMALVIRRFGVLWLDRLLPPAAMGAIVAIIGLELAPVASSMAGFGGGHGSGDAVSQGLAQVTSMTTLGVTVLASLLLRGFWARVPILIGILVGTFLAYVLGLADFALVNQAPWFSWPKIHFPSFDWEPLVIFFPAYLVVLTEHVGHLVVTGQVIGKPLLKEPGLHRSLFGDGLANLISGVFGAPPNTTYGENIGVMAITGVYSVWVLAGTACIAMSLAFLGKFAALLQCIPKPVMGGISLLLFGVIAVSGLRMLIDRKVDYSNPRNMTLTALILSVGLSGIGIDIGPVALKGMTLAVVVAIALGFTLIIIDKGKTEPHS